MPSRPMSKRRHSHAEKADGRRPFCGRPNLDFTPNLVQITSRDRKFTVHKSILGGSQYFVACLEGEFLESRENKITLTDVDTGQLDFYLRCSYAQAIDPDAYVVRVLLNEENSPLLERLAGLWEMADRFVNTSLMQVAATSLRDRIDSWGTMLRDEECFTESVLFDTVKEAANAFAVLSQYPELRQDDYHERTLSEYLVNKFCRYCSPEIWQKLAVELPAEFVAEVSTVWAKQCQRSSGRPFEDIMEGC